MSIQAKTTISFNTKKFIGCSDSIISNKDLFGLKVLSNFLIDSDVNKPLIAVGEISSYLRDDIYKKRIILNGHCPLSSNPPPLA